MSRRCRGEKSHLREPCWPERRTPVCGGAGTPPASGSGVTVTATTDCLDGNEAAARIAHRLSEVIAIYPITPASPMGEWADAWSARQQPNLWGTVPEVLALQSEAGAAGTLHGALQGGALATTFTASQGLLLMLPNLFKIAGELLPCAIHVAARTLATHALSIFGDHSDVMAARSTGFAMLCASSVQEAHDFALVSHAATLRTRVPFLHFFDGFRTSHEVQRIEVLGDEDLRALVDEAEVLAHRARRLTPDAPVLRGSAQNPDVFFQAREASNRYHDAVPGVVEECFATLAARSGRRYGLAEYSGAPDADRVLVLMGSGAGAAGEAVDALVASGERVGLVTLRLFRPFPAAALLAALPAGVRAIAVLDRCKEPGSAGEPLYQDVVTTLAEAAAAGRPMPRVLGGRYGLASKEFTPAMAKGVLDELAQPAPRNRFTIGIVDDVTHTSLPWDPEFRTEGAGGRRAGAGTGDGAPSDGARALFFGLGSDGTVGAARSTVAILTRETPLHAQGYFVYDSKKSGAITVSHVRFGPAPIRSTYQIERAEFVSCHHFDLLFRIDVLERAAHGAKVLLNTPQPPEAVWDELPLEVQQQILERDLELWVIDADRVAREAGMGGRINTVMQPCFFALSGALERERALAAIRSSIEKAYAKRGPTIVQRNLAAVDAALGALHRVETPATADSSRRRRPLVPPDAPEFVQRVTARLLAGQGDALPVSALPPDGTFPTGTARFEKRALAAEIPLWDPTLCIDCGKCALVCPHAAIRMKVYSEDALDDAPAEFLHKPFRSREQPEQRLTIQVAPDDCTGCGVCVDVCPARSKSEAKHKAIDMAPVGPHRERERERFAFFLGLPEQDPAALEPATVKAVETRQPLFEFSGACAGCGETPYLKLLSQLFGDRMLVANATGCSSIFGGNLPTTPWSVGPDGRGPAWANSLFEDNAEFGLGMRLALERRVAEAQRLLSALSTRVGADLADAILADRGSDEASIAAQRRRVAELKRRLQPLAGGPDPHEAADARRLLSSADDLVRKSVWIVGGDGWAYDIGAPGLDHVLAGSRDVNVLVLDTQVYSNTGGQASKATPRGAVAKFAAGGKQGPRKDLGLIASAYGHVYVAQIAMGADDAQTLKALREADAWPGPSLVIAYSTCIAHGIDMARSMSHQRDAVRSGFWPLWRYHPGAEAEHRPFHLDSRKPTLPLRAFAEQEARFAMLLRSAPAEAERLLALAQGDADERWRYYAQLAGVERRLLGLVPAVHPAAPAPAPPSAEDPEE
ncbi:pyruvate:ferredoxin (flavodoxin) oxidoreductase [Myxococcota bacterium]|nr:pyruvate:ferredoxin (flavodoxin) oxidoreductase [Myxococcota bacterium]